MIPVKLLSDFLLKQRSKRGKRALSTHSSVPCSETSTEILSQEPSPRSKKSVIFADFVGGKLTSERGFDKSQEPVYCGDLVTRKILLNIPLKNLFTPAMVPQNIIEPPCRLEQVNCDFPSIYGIVNVINVGQKEVFVCYTTDEWKTWRDLRCEYCSSRQQVQTMISSTSEQQLPREDFSFKIQLHKDFEADGMVWFAVGYRDLQTTEIFWDNNNGLNYLVVCKFQAFIDEKWILCDKKFFSYHKKKDYK